MEKFLEFMKLADAFLPAIIDFVFLAFTPVIVGLLVNALSDRNRRIVATVAEGVFNSVEAFAKTTEMKSDDKLAEGFKQVAEKLGRSMKKKEEAVARETFARLANQTKLFKPAD